MKKLGRNLLALFGMFLCLLTVFSCSGMNDSFSGRIALVLPGSQRSDDGTYVFNVSIDGPSKKSVTGESGQTVVFEDLIAGDYEILVEAFEKDTKYFYADGCTKAQVTAGQTSNVKVKLSCRTLPPTITKQPEDVAVNLLTDANNGASGSATLTIDASVKQSGDLSYTWYICDKDGKYKEYDNPCGNDKTLQVRFSEDNKNQTYYYICKVTHTKDNDNQAVTSRVVKVSVGDVKTLSSITATYNKDYFVLGTNQTTANLPALADFTITENYGDGTTATGDAGNYKIECNITSQAQTVGNVPYTITSTKNSKAWETVTVLTKYPATEKFDVTLSLQDTKADLVLDESNSATIKLSASLNPTPTTYSIHNQSGSTVKDSVSYDWYKNTSESNSGGTKLNTTQTTVDNFEYSFDTAGTYYLYCVATLIPDSTWCESSEPTTATSAPLEVTVTQPTPPSTQNPNAIQSWDDLKSAVENASGEETITVSGNFNATATINVKRKVTIVADAGGCTITRDSSFVNQTTSGNPMDYFFLVDNGGDLTLGGATSGSLILDGGYKAEDDTTKASSAIVGVYVTKAGTNKYRITLKNNCVIQNNYNKSSGNYRGGGILYYNVATDVSSWSDGLDGLVIDGGTVKDCYSTMGGGIYFNATNNDKTPQLHIKSGSICGNESINGTNATNGGGIYLSAGTLIMEGGEITGNKACVGVNNFSDTAGGGGIFAKSGTTIKISGGSITGNSCCSSGTNGGSGGGVYFGGTLFEISGNTVTIKDNTSGSNASSNKPNIAGQTTINGSSYTFNTASTSGTNYTYIENGVAGGEVNPQS